MNPLDLAAQFKGLQIDQISVLDLGAGLYASPLSSQMLLLPFKRIVSVEYHRETVQKLRAMRCAYGLDYGMVIYDDMLNLLHTLPKAAYDVVTFIDSLEHLDRVDAFAAIKAAKRVARARVLIWLPLGDCPQDPSGGNPYQLHRSTWTAEDLIGLNFTVTVFKEFHQHFSPPVDAAWAVFKKRGSA